MKDVLVSPLALTIMYWLHMLATVVWIGGLTTLSVIVLPAAQKTLDRSSFAALLTQIQARLQQVGWFSLAVLGVTGMFQMSANPSYGGLLVIDNDWAIAIFSKHIVIGLMILVSGYVTWGLLPTLKRNALRRAAGRDVDEALEARLQRRETWMLRMNVLLSIIVLLCTAWARSAS